MGIEVDCEIQKILAEIEAETPDEHWIESLNNGARVLIRPLHVEDRHREFAFIKALSPTTRRFRFLSTFREPSASLLAQMMDIDYPRRLAYVALVHQDGELTEIGVSRYAAIDGSQRCECALVVADRWQRQGLGLLLMGHLIKAARANRFDVMTSLDLTENPAMQHLATKLGFLSVRQASDFSETVHELDLSV